MFVSQYWIVAVILNFRVWSTSFPSYTPTRPWVIDHLQFTLLYTVAVSPSIYLYLVMNCTWNFSNRVNISSIWPTCGKIVILKRRRQCWWYIWLGKDGNNLFAVFCLCKLFWFATLHFTTFIIQLMKWRKHFINPLGDENRIPDGESNLVI